MIVRQLNYYWNEHWECLVLVGPKNVEKVVVLEETHGSVGHLQVDTTDAPHNALEEPRDQMFDFVHFTHF